MDDLESVRRAFTDACATRKTRSLDVVFRLGGRRVRLRVAGTELAELLTSAFASVIDPRGASEPPDAADTNGVDLSIAAWDRAATGVGCPGLGLVPDRTDTLGPGLMFQYRNGHLLRYDRASIVKCLDRRSRELFLCVEDAAQLGLNDRTRPFEHFLRAWAHDRSLHVLHAGLVAHDGRGLLLGGQGGSGKSTTAIACALGGLDFLGDDFVATAATPDEWFGHALYDTVRVDTSNLERFPELKAHCTLPSQPRDGFKSLVYMSDVLPEATQRVASTRVAAIAIPTIAGTGTTFVRPTSRAEVLRRLAPSTLLRALGGGAASFAHMTELVRHLPCYELVLGASIDTVPALITDLLDSAAS